MATLDHLVIAAPTLEAGTQWVEAQTGLTLSPGGAHATMGTHNRLLSLGPDAYLEVIAVHPAAQAPDHPRWFALDELGSAIRLQAWVVRCEDLAAALAGAPPGSGAAQPFARGDLRWRMAVPEDGRLPFDNLFPALIEWQGTAHPAPRLPDAGCRLQRLQLTHPRAQALRAALAGLLDDPRIEVVAGPTPSLAVDLATPAGPRRL